MTWERRWHPLREEWVTITSHRNSRPWSGSSPVAPLVTDSKYESECYLCPGNERISGEKNPDYQSVFCFNNDHPSFTSPPPEFDPPRHLFFQVAPAGGECRVMCYSPEHDGSLARLSTENLKVLIDTWADETERLIDRADVASVLIFENKGEVVGVSNSHPHCQIYAPGFVLDGLQQEHAVFQRYTDSMGRGLLEDLNEAELHDGRRIVVNSSDTIAFVPYFARFPYETFVIPRERHSFIHELSADEREDLASVLQEVLVRYDNLWQMAFPYMLLLHQAPVQAADSSFHFHIQIHPPMRQPGLQKYLASVETGVGHFLNDGCPEEKAAELRAVPSIHYLLNSAEMNHKAN